MKRRGITERVADWLDVDGLGAYGFLYSVSADARVTPSDLVHAGCSEELSAMLTHVPFDHQPEFIRSTYLTVDCCAVSQLEGWAGSRPAQVGREMGVNDQWGINGRNWNNHGVAVLVNRARAEAFTESESEACTRIAFHLAAAHRLRSKLAHADLILHAEAVIDARGSIQHAVGAAQAQEARSALSLAVHEREQIRGASRDDRAHSALAAWKGRVDARWTLIDHIERDGSMQGEAGA